MITDQAIRNLFKEGVFVVPETNSLAIGINSENQAVASKPVLDKLGNNSKKVVVLVNNKAEAIISDLEKEFLLKILAAVKLTLNDIAIVNIADKGFSTLQELESCIPVNKCLIFGYSGFIEPKSKYLITTIDDHIEALLSDALSEIVDDREKKKALWNELQKLFAD
jgi:hypothetical protein